MPDTMEPTTVETAHDKILKTAANVANRMLREAQDIQAASYAEERFNPQVKRGRIMEGEIFRADPSLSEKGGLCLSLDELTVRASTEAELADLHRIGVAAVKEAIANWHSELFVGLIVGEAKQDRNYFDRFDDK